MRYKYLALFWDSARDSTRDSTSDSTPIPTVTLTLTVFPASPVPTLNHPRECVSVTLLHVTITYLSQNSVLSQKSATRDEQKIKINSKEYLQANLKSSFHLI